MTISRKTGMTDTYVIEIQVGIDVAFACMAVIALDEIYHNGRNDNDVVNDVAGLGLGLGLMFGG